MTDRIQVTRDHLNDAFDLLDGRLDSRIKRHGDMSHASVHESLGVIAEEYKELLDEIHANNVQGVADEGIDLALAAIYMVASLIAKGKING